MRINRPVFDPFQTAPVYPRFTMSSRAHCPPLSRCPRPCPAVHAPDRAQRPHDAQPSPRPHHAPRAPVRAHTRPRCPDSRPRCHAVTLSSVPHAQTHAQAPTSPCERVHALPRVLHCPSPRTRPERPRAPPVSLATRAHAHAYTRPHARAPVHLCTL